MRAAPEAVRRSQTGTANDPAERRKLSAILCADVAGYSRLMGSDEAGTFQALARLRLAIEPLVSRRGGRIVSTAGDGMLMDFASVVDALGCAVDIQERARRLNAALPTDRHLELRIGVNLGDVIVAEDGDLYGDGVNIAARLQTLATPGEVCLSQPVYEQVRNKLDLSFRPLGTHRVKNIANPVRVYAVADATVSARPRRRASWRLLSLVAVGIVLVMAVVGWRLGYLSWPGAAHEPLPTPKVANLATPARIAERTTVAVLPFKNLSLVAGQDYFIDGITEDIINALGRYSSLLVAAKSASFQFKNKDMSPEQAGRALDVRYLVEGSVRRAGDRLRITVELTEAATGFHLWSDNYNVEAKDIFDVQDDITKRIVGATAVKLTQFERNRLLRKPTASLAAYEFVLRGRTGGLVNQTRPANDEARLQYQKAIELDPNYAEAYAALGWTYYEAAVSGWTEFPNDAVSRAQQLAEKALALDPATTNAYRLLSAIGVFRGNYGQALAQIDQALALNPSDAENVRERGYVLLWSGKPAEAVPWLEATLRLDASESRSPHLLGIAKYFLGQYAEAAAALERALTNAPGRAVELDARAVLAAVYAKRGNMDAAARERRVVLRLAPFFSAERFAAQYGTAEARREMLEGLKAAGFQ